MSNRLEAVLAEILPWAKATFPQATPYSIAEHLKREAIELAKQPRSGKEIADVAILLFELVDALDIDLPRTLAEKHAINLRREWGQPDADGVVEHVRIRPPWDEFWFELARHVSTRATCPRAHIGAVLVKFNRIVSVGYNGAPEGEPHCPSSGPELEAHMALVHCEVSRHAETNALRNAFSNPYGASLYGVGARTVCPNCRDRLTAQGVTDIHWSEQ
jgi:dCMP deaminase